MKVHHEVAIPSIIFFGRMGAVPTKIVVLATSTFKLFSFATFICWVMPHQHLGPFYIFLLTLSTPDILPGSVTITDLGLARVPRAVLRTAHGPAMLTALGI